MKIIFFALFVCVSSSNLFAQNKIYRLLDKTTKADINYNKLNSLNQVGSGYNLINKIFKPKPGLFTVYRLICTYKGLSHETDKQKAFHDLIILKTNNSNIIVDGFQYTLEWGEEPFTTDLYKYTAMGIKLTNDLNINTLKFLRVDDIGNNHQIRVFLKENGVIKVN